MGCHDEMLGNTKTENVTSYQINKGLRIARQLLLDLVSSEIGVNDYQS